MSSIDPMKYFSCVYDKNKRLWSSAYKASQFNKNESMGQVLFEHLKQNPQKILQVIQKPKRKKKIFKKIMFSLSRWMTRLIQA